MKSYFAYGSNLWEKQMKQRCPESRKLCRATLHGYRWIITTRGYASVVECKGESVEGVIYQLSESDEAELDRFEGVSNGFYQKAELPIGSGSWEIIALVYIDPITEEGHPHQEYIARINSGLADAELPESYVNASIRRFIPENP
jgi:gamma-glutamylcyclotransferase (GGCT)/AIG2-like uncharacterized protein YtfP